MTVCVNHEVPCKQPCTGCGADCTEAHLFDSVCVHCGAGIDFVGGEFWLSAASGLPQCDVNSGGHEPDPAYDMED